MACVYIKDDATYENYYDLLGEFFSKSEELTSELEFHRSVNPVQEIENKIEALNKEYEKAKNNGTELGESATKIVDTMKKNIFGMPSTNSMIEFTSDAAKKIGTVIHKMIEVRYNWKEAGLPAVYTPWNGVRDEFINTIKDIKANLPRGVTEPEAQTMIPWIMINTESLPEQQIIDCIDSILNSNQLKGKKLLFEKNIFCTDTGGKPVHGRFDCIAIDKDGHVTVVDFKTSKSADLYKNKASAYYAQLRVYQQILAARGIAKEADIDIAIGHISYNALAITKPLVASILDFNTNTGVTSVTLKNQIDKELRDYFPLTQYELNETDQKAKYEEIKQTQDTIFSEYYLKRDEPESLKKYFDGLNEDDTYRRRKDGKTYKIYQASDTEYKLMDTKDMSEHIVSKEEFVKEELEAIQKLNNEMYDKFVKAFESRDINRIRQLLNTNKNTEGLLTTLLPYFSPEYELVEDPVYAHLGLLVFKNQIDNSVSLVQLTTFSNINKVYDLAYADGERRSQNLLANVLSQETLSKYPKATQPAMVSKILIMKALTAIAMYHNIATGADRLKIGKISVISTTSGHSMTLLDDYSETLQQFGILAHGSKQQGHEMAQVFNNINNTLKNEFDYVSSEDRAFNTLHSILYLVYPALGKDPDAEWETLKLAKDNMSDIQTRINILKRFRKKLEQDYPAEISKAVADRQQNTLIQKLYTQAEKLEVALQGFLTSDSFNVSATGATLDSSLRAGYQMLSQGRVGQFTSEGDMVVGFLQGTETSNPLSMPDRYLREIARVYTASYSRASYQAEQVIGEVNKATSKWLKSKEKSIVAFALGDHKQYYAQLMVQDENGKISPKMQFKNPFEDNSINADDKEYLKVVLWTLYRMQRSDNKFSDEEKEKSYEEISKDPSFETRFNEVLKVKPRFRNVPLRTAQDSTILLQTAKHLIKGQFDEAGKIFKRKLKKMSSLVDPRGLTYEQEKIKEEHMRCFEAYNMYTDVGNRTNNIGGNPDKFEFNVNFLVNDFVYNVVQCDVQQDVLDYASSIISVIKGIAMTTGRDLTAQIDAIIQYTKSSIFNSNNVDKKWEDVAKALKASRTVLSAAAIALRPVLMVKELVVGRAKNHIYSASGYFENEGITEKNMAKGEAIVFKDGIWEGKVRRYTGHMDPGERTKVEALNFVFGIANVDVNVKSYKSTADRFGLLNQQGDVLYYTSTRPDFYNRMAIMIAKMDADGCWEAMKLDKDNRLVYDMSLDSRYSVYWKYRNNEPKPEDSNFKEFQEQKARYLWALNEFNKDGFTNTETKKPFVAGEALPLPYTNREISSLKEVIGELYGFYNHEEKTIFQSQTYAELFMAFKIYLAGEIRHYFKNADNNTARGKVVQLKDEYGNPLYETIDDKTGATVLVPETSHIDEEGHVVYHNPKYGWQADAVEGLVNSTLLLIRDVFTEQGRQELRKNKARQRNAEIFLLRCFIFGFLAALLKAIYSGFKEEDMQEVKMAYNVATKASQDLSFYHSILEPVDEAGFVGVDMLQSLTKDLVATLTDGEEGLQKLIYNSAAIKDLGFTV